MRLNEVTRAYFSRLATISPPEEAYLYTHLDDPAAVEKIRAKSPHLDALFRVTITPTIEQGGFREQHHPPPPPKRRSHGPSTTRRRC